jgi:hypothetical protein
MFCGYPVNPKEFINYREHREHRGKKENEKE